MMALVNSALAGDTFAEALEGPASSIYHLQMRRQNCKG